MSNPLLDLMTQGESGATGYNAYNRGTYVDAHGGRHIRGPAGAIDFSTLPVGQVHDRQHLRGDDPNRLFAVGKYQIIPATMDDAIDRLQLDRNQPFTPAVQDRIFSDYLISDKRPEIKNYITGKPGSTLEAAQGSLAAEWASFGDPANGGRSHYPPPNAASITLTQSADALNHMRAEYQADIAKGMSPDPAWKAVTDSEPSHTKAPATQHTPEHSHGALKQEDHGTSVHTLQQNLSRLGYTDAHGQPLRADGHFGIDTRHAVERFQHDHHLTVDGIAGPKTLTALHAQTQATAKTSSPKLDDPRNPDHALYEEALAGVRHLDAQAGRMSDQHSANLAAALVVAAKKEGLTRIDTVALSTDDGARVFAMQNATPLPKYAEVPTLPSLNTPIEQSSKAAQQMNQPQAQPPIQAPSVPTQNASAPSLSL